MYQSYKITNTLDSQAGKETIDNHIWNIWQLWSNEVIDEMLLWTNSMQQNVEIVTAEIQ